MPFARAIEAAAPADAVVVAGANPPNSHASILLEDFMAKPAGPEVDAAHAKVGPDTIGKFLFTSGSTGTPKGVINTQRMMASNQAMLAAVNPSFGAEPTTLIDWLPWSHTFGGNNNFNLVLRNGGSFYIDAGKPVQNAIDETVQNLREISPTVYYNVPKGFEMLLPYLQADEGLRKIAVRKAAGLRLRRRGAAAACARGIRAARPGDGRRSRADPHLARLDRDRPLGDQRHRQGLARRASSASPIRASTVKLVPNGEKLEARLQEPEHHAGLLAPARADGRGL